MSSEQTSESMGPMKTMLPEQQYDDFMKQLSKLSKRKQAKWSKRLYGRVETTLLVFRDGKLVDVTPRGDQEVVSSRGHPLTVKPGEPAALNNYSCAAAKEWMEDVLIYDDHERQKKRQQGEE